MTTHSKLQREVIKLKKRISKLESSFCKQQQPQDENDPAVKKINEIIDGTWERSLKGIDALNEMAEMIYNESTIEIVDKSVKSYKPVN